MIGVKLASSRTARCILLGLATVSAAVLITTDSADARRRHSKHRHHHVQRSSYNPPFASLIVDGNSGATLQATSADAIRHPASLTKIMTLYMLFERLESGKITLDSAMEVSAHAAAQAPTKLGLRAGQTLRVEDAIKGMVTRSANDAAVVVAEALGGSEDEFSKMMTRKARALGMNKTTYVNASGLPDDDQVTTARDQALLGRAIQDRFPRYYRYFATKAFTFRGRVIRGHNRLLGSVEGVDGIKTGYTRASGFNLVTSIKRGNRYLIGVVLGGRSGGSRDAAMRKLLAEHIDEGATRRTVAAITERAPAREVAANEAREDAASKARVTPEAPPVVQVQGAVQLASAIPEPVPVPAPRAPDPQAEAQAEKPAPAPLTSGVISAPMSIVPGSEEPMKPVRVKTVHVRMGGTKAASAAPVPVAAAQTTTGALPVRPPEPVAKPQVEPVRTGAAAPQVRFPAPLPTAISHQSPGLGQGTLGPAPTQPLPPPRTAMAYADPNRGAPPSTLGAQAAALANESTSPQPAAAPQPQAVSHGNASKPAASARSGWIIQVGALESEREARQRLEAARDNARALLGSADPFTETVSKGRKTLYRARFAGLDQGSAEAACRKLKRSDISCITIRN
ncbi:MAG: D-alanyl-D-alanine carboxypeptidase [Afipia sp.]